MRTAAGQPGVERKSANIFVNSEFGLDFSDAASFTEYGSEGMNEATSDGNSEHNSSADEDNQLRLRLKRKLQRNRTSFTNEQIEQNKEQETLISVI